MTKTKKPFFPILETLVVSFVGGFTFTLLQIPLSWMLGPMAATMLWRPITRRNLLWPSVFRDIGLMVLGYLLGASFTTQTLEQITYQLPSMLLVTVLTIGFSFLLGYLVSKGAKIDFMSGIIGSIPGGLTHMVVLGEEIKGIDTTIVTFMQTFRLMVIIFFIPFLIGQRWLGDIGPTIFFEQYQDKSTSLSSWYSYLIYFVVVLVGARLGQKIGLPTASLLGPLLITAGCVIAGFHSPEIPSPIILAAQLMVGAYMGLIMEITSLSNWKKLAPYTLISCFALVFFCLFLGWQITFFYPMSIYTSILAIAPGGIAEMGVTARDVHADLSMVSAYQIFRVLFILFTIPPFLKWLVKRVRTAIVAEKPSESTGI